MTQAPQSAVCSHHLLHAMQAGWLQALLAADSNIDSGQHAVAHRQAQSRMHGFTCIAFGPAIKFFMP